MKIARIIHIIFYILVSLTPLIFLEKTSELFEFNKIVLVYGATVLILVFWAMASISERKFIFRKTPLTIPIAILLISQIISTLFSIDFRTSLLGYYSRFNGGLASMLSYAVLYFAFVTFMDSEHTKRVLKLAIASCLLVAIIGILEHFNFSVSCILLRGTSTNDCWVQDAGGRVFATLGQPNWLAAYLVMLIPITWILGIKRPRLSIILSTTLFVTLLFTKSRSGILGLAISEIAYLLLIFYFRQKKLFKTTFISGVIMVALTLAIGIPGTQNLSSVKESALESGGTESGVIRQIVWRGALDVWKHNPIVGTGLETFAYSYYKYRPVEHNLVSEWDYIYNKAHNEYLNYAANSGIFGLITYLTVIIVSIYQIIKNSNNFLRIGLLAGYLGLLVTNFFGFSVVLTSLFFFLYPAVAYSLVSQNKFKTIKTNKLAASQKLLISGSLILSVFALFILGRYWYSDTLYAEGKLAEAIKLSPGESVYWLEIAKSSKNAAMELSESGDNKNAIVVANDADNEAKNALVLSPNNINTRKIATDIYTDLSAIDSSYLLTARQIIIDTVPLAPTDAKVFYLLGAANARINQNSEAINALKYALVLKPIYDDAQSLLRQLQKSP